MLRHGSRSVLYLADSFQTNCGTFISCILHVYVACICNEKQEWRRRRSRVSVRRRDCLTAMLMAYSWNRTTGETFFFNGDLEFHCVLQQGGTVARAGNLLSE